MISDYNLKTIAQFSWQKATLIKEEWMEALTVWLRDYTDDSSFVDFNNGRLIVVQVFASGVDNNEDVKGTR